MRVVLYIINIVTGLLLLGCSKERDVTLMKTDANDTLDVPSTITHKVFFGHQSVGNNILTGIKSTSPQVPVFNIKGKPVPRDIEAAIFHQGIGQNENPMLKMEDFKKRLIGEGVGAIVDVAMMKLCYVDITRNTDIAQVFKEYVNTVDSIKNSSSSLQIIHCTVPLTSEKPRSVKQVIKKILFGKSDNIARNKFNTMLLNEFGNNSKVYDLAKVESTRPDGSRECFIKGGETFFAMYPGYTDDGGHLNCEGQKRAAIELLKIIERETK